MHGTERKIGKETEGWICTGFEERMEKKKEDGYARNRKRKWKRNKIMDMHRTERKHRKEIERRICTGQKEKMEKKQNSKDGHAWD